MDSNLKAGKIFEGNRRLQMGTAKTATLLFAVLCVVFAVFQQTYKDFDNYTISIVVNGLFGSDFYCRYLNPVLCVICRAVTALFPAMDSFAALSAGMVLVCLCWLFYLFMKMRKSHGERIVFLLLLVAIAFGDDLFHANFTVQTALFTATGIITLALILRGKLQKRRFVAAGTLFLCCGALWRVQAMLLAVPFIILDIIFVFARARQGAKGTGIDKDTAAEQNSVNSGVKKLVSIYAPALFIVLLLIGISEAVQHAPRYAEAMRFDAVRQTVGDYPLKDWDEVQEELPQMLPHDYETLKGWMYADTDRVDAEYLEQIAEAATTTAYKASLSSLIPMTLELAKRCGYLARWSAVFAGLFVLMMTAQYNWLVKLEVLLAYGGAYLCGMYFLYKGRCLARILMCIALALFSILFVLLLENKENHFNRWSKGLMLCLTGVVLILVARKVQFVTPQTALTAGTNVDNSAWMTAEMPEDELYIWYYEELRVEIVNTLWKWGKLPTKEILKHNITEGAWQYGQVYYWAHLEDINAKNPAKALLTRDNTYYAATDCTDMLLYLQDHYSPSVSAEQVGEKFGVPIWKFSE